ncbi:MAG TPA: ABC transporter ATP-binding protein [Hyphomicrobiales bacterium]|nr:ABC transporter ATP-binding protein [Hyphomicrobiales bacterium]
MSAAPPQRPVLEVEHLSVDIETPGGSLHAVSDVSFAVKAGETLSLVGESGCGKTITALSMLRLAPKAAATRAARLSFEGQDLQALDAGAMAALRGDRVAMIFQDPMTALNPVYTIGDQLTEAYLAHRAAPRREARERAIYLLGRVGIPDPKLRLGQFPHELSGGLRQRMMIAMALMCGPALIVADEPTTALDVTVQAQILALLKDLQAEFGMALVLITHDLGVVAHVADRVAVMYAGRVVESAAVADIFHDPQHPYTRGLLACVPSVADRGRRLGTIAGMVPSLIGEQSGCSFRNRCPLALPACAEGEAIVLAETAPAHEVRCIRAPAATRAMATGERSAATAAAPALGQPLLACEGLTKLFQTGGLFSRKAPFTAVAGIDLAIRKGEVLAVVGESGSGKTTLGRMLLGLLPPTTGTIRLDGRPLAEMRAPEIARRIQPVFQDPYSSLNPRKSVAQIIGFPLSVQGIGTAAERRERVEDIAAKVGLSRRHLQSYPSQMSGGQRQRVAIARALAVEPEIIVLDEPTSALDVSIQAQILNLLQELRERLGLTYVFISHDLGVVEHLADRVAVMHRGKVVELGPAAAILEHPQDPYTRMLLDSVLAPEPGELPAVAARDPVPAQ